MEMQNIFHAQNQALTLSGLNEQTRQLQSMQGLAAGNQGMTHPSVLIPGFAPHGVPLPQPMSNSLFNDAQARAAQLQVQANASTPAGADGVGSDNTLTYISGRKIVNNVVTKISTPYSTGHIPCPYGCGRSFKHATQKAIHIRKVHTGERPFVCKVEGCGKAFYSSGDLKSHEKTHSGLKPFECPTCGKALSSRNALKVHIKALHTLERPFKCEVPNCGMTYMTRLDLDRHMKKHVKWEQKEEKAKMANLEKRTEKAERKLRQVMEKQVKIQSGEARVSVNLSAGRLVALAPGEPPPEGAVAYFVPNANGAGMPLDKLDVTYARGKYRRGASKSAGGDATSGMEPSSSLLSREGEEGDGDDPTVQGATDAQNALRAAANGTTADGGNGSVAPVAARKTHKRKALTLNPNPNPPKPDNAGDAEAALRATKKKLLETRLREEYEQGGFKGAIPFQSWRRGLSTEVCRRFQDEVDKLVHSGMDGIITEAA